MATHHLAQGLASLGRHGDSMLMHVSPEEVAGLQALGQMTGHKLHINPDTGMPEAFDFGDFFSSLLPTAAGFLMGGPAGAALGLKGTAATMAPIAAGMATGALVAGAKGEDVLAGGLMGGLGGYGGGNLGSSLGKMGAQGGYEAGQAVTQGTAQTTAEGMKALEGANPFFGSANTIPALMTNSTGAASGVGAAAPMTYSQGLGQMGRGAMNLLSPEGYAKFTSPEIGGSAMQIGAPLGMAALSAMQPEPIDMSEEEARRKAEENKYRSSTGGLNLAASSGLNLGLPSLTLASGGVINANQSTISSGGTQDLYGSPDNTTGNPPLSQDGYGIGRLDKLAQQGSLTKAGDMFYAAGGPVSFAEGGDKGMNLDELPSLNVNTGMQGGGGGGINDLLYQINDSAAMSPILKMLFEKMPQSARGEFIGSGMGSFFGLQERPRQEYYTSSGERTLGYAHGGYLDGAGDGMSDSIPATIEGKQPARLADGEFVVPADVVSHIGNGSSKAGSKRLYAMLDKVRKARTGHTKQGKEINPNKYMPA
jgi:hypothetical protein